MIRNVHMVGGETSKGGGFIVQSKQNHFIVESCSSTGVIGGDHRDPNDGCSDGCRGGGGICGNECSGDIMIMNCWSSGEIQDRAGGIAGRHIGINGNGSTVTITRCHSTGDIVGEFSGGICGQRSGYDNGHVIITHSYSTGKIHGPGSGGICGIAAGVTGNVTIEQCYSLGEISGPGSGGITGANTGRLNGHVSITNCYSHGNITGSDHAGGICGLNTGLSSDGAVILTNVYASGDINCSDAGGLIGSIHNSARRINITMSVYSGYTGNMIGLNDAADKSLTKERNSAHLGEIIGTVYCYNGHRQECWDNKTIWQAIDEDFPILQNMPTPYPAIPRSTSPSKTISSTPTASPSRTTSWTPAVSPSVTPAHKQNRVWMELPVQYPRRSVIMNKVKRGFE